MKLVDVHPELNSLKMIENVDWIIPVLTYIFRQKVGIFVSECSMRKTFQIIQIDRFSIDHRSFSETIR